MLKIVPVEQMRRIEAAADANGITYNMMMENAGRATAQAALAMLRDSKNPTVVVLVGTGNNGGDGLVAARYLAEQEAINIHCYLLKSRTKTDANFKAIKETIPYTIAEDDAEYSTLQGLLHEATLIIDALFGIGIRLPIEGRAAAVLQLVNNAVSRQKDTRPDEMVIYPATPTYPIKQPTMRVLAVDCPSGVDCDTGQVDENTIPADETITFIAAKPGLLLPPGLDVVGKLSIAPINIPNELPEMQEAPISMVMSTDVRRLLPQRPANSHKGTYGRALLVAGSLNYTGAPGLAAESAYRAGAGLVTVGAPGPVITTLAARLSEPTWLLLPHDMGVIAEKAVTLVLGQLKDYDALLLGPGWGQEDTTGEFLQHLLEKANEPIQSQKKRRAIGFTPHEEIAEDMEETVTLPSLVIDADGLNLLGKIEKWWTLLPENTILTPHPGEMSRLTERDTKDLQNNRLEVAQHYAKEWNVVLLLKGAYTAIASPSGELRVLPFKNDALATAGTGDILAGLITGLLAQGLTAFDAAVVGGYVHGLAGELTRQQHGTGRSIIAGDVLKVLSKAWAIIENS